MSTPTITSLVPGRDEAMSIDDLVAAYTVDDRAVTTVRVNFVASLDGGATVDGVSGDLGGPADKVVFDILRRLADVVLVGAGTVRDEGYGAMRLDVDAATWRDEHDLPLHPVFAIVSGSLDLDLRSDVFTLAPVRPLVVTTDRADPAKRAAIEAVADVVVCGDEHVEPARVVEALAERGLRQILCEGGPALFGSFIDADAVDEFCLTISPTLVGGQSSRISAGPSPAAPRGFHLQHLLRSEDLLLSRYVRARPTSAPESSTR
ncbi:pyrimidine reductase family protein [Plantibacter sp. ME-Dv--P-095]|uniref:pyrimidine reductase family protein n=1 Tax=Plantibacter sp. ME-Dv--P-095 TaxID=3040299 RepID=UPI00254F48BC|nr:pyrimidine reductase family protein [Plantibacter sp. ME-Dv--P-095]